MLKLGIISGLARLVRMAHVLVRWMTVEEITVLCLLQLTHRHRSKSKLRVIVRLARLARVVVGWMAMKEVTLPCLLQLTHSQSEKNIMHHVCKDSDRSYGGTIAR